MQTVSYSEARASLATLWDQVINEREPIQISRRGKEAVSIIATAELNALLETAYLLRSPANVAWLRASIAEMERGEAVALPLAALRRELTGGA